MSDIDIVIPWVDGNDPDWQREFEKARKTHDGAGEGDGPAGGDPIGNSPVVATGGDENAAVIRYRDWGTLPYLLRGIERFAPWAGRVHFVTRGHLPEWLDTANPRLNLVTHGDFIPREYLPTFASRPIELNVHRIASLAPRFILFNDDMFLTRPVPETRFFRRGLPCDMARLSLVGPSTISHTVLNMIEITARRHDRRTAMRSHPLKWWSPRYGVGNLLKTLDLSLWRGWSGLADTHMPQPYLRRTFEQMWLEEGAVLDATCRQKFRSPFGVNHWLMRYEQLVSGSFSPVGFGDARLDELHEGSISRIEEYIRRQRHAMICLNDSPLVGDFETVRDRLRAAFEAILPDKSSFEL
jgi:hypothetical protein